MNLTRAVCVAIVAATLSITMSSGSGAAENADASALAVENQMVQALLANDAGALAPLLADDWIVISTYGGVGDRSGFLQVIKSGDFHRATMTLSEERVRTYGEFAVVTARVRTSGTIFGRKFNLQERSTDVLRRTPSGWKSVLTQETEIHKS